MCNNRIFSEKILSNIMLSDYDASIFRKKSVLHTLFDNVYGESVTFYLHVDGRILVDSVKLKENI